MEKSRVHFAFGFTELNMRNKSIKVLSCLLVAVAFWLSLDEAAVQAWSLSYHVGNSLTWDGLGGGVPGKTQGIEALAANAGYALEAKYHIRNSNPLHLIWQNPSLVNEYESPLGTFDASLPGLEWDFVTLQPHISGGSTLALDESSILSFIDLTRTNPANSDTAFFVYGTWPTTPSFPYQDFWESSSPDEDSTPTLMKAEYFENLMNRVTSQTDAIVRLIPTGEVFYELDKKVAVGGVPGIDETEDFYRDDRHLSDVGRYIASTTVFSTMFQKDPHGVLKPANAYGDDELFTPEFYEVIWDTVWNVVSGNAYTGLSDFNNDGLTDWADLGIWESAYGVNAAGDADGDGDTDGDDFLILQRQYVVHPQQIIATIPEPASWLIGFAACLFLTCRREAALSGWH